MQNAFYTMNYRCIIHRFKRFIHFLKCDKQIHLP